MKTHARDSGPHVLGVNTAAIILDANFHCVVDVASPYATSIRLVVASRRLVIYGGGVIGSKPKGSRAELSDEYLRYAFQRI